MSADRPPRSPRGHSEQRIWATRVVLGLAGTGVGLLAGIAYLVLSPAEKSPLAEALENPEVRQQVIARLVAENQSLFDAHPDGDVGRVHLQGLKDREMDGMTISTNRFGMRERDYAVPKPEDVVRVVLLGDSMVFGLGVAAEDRLGVYLERWLKERSPEFEGRVECLHLGASSWNIRAETAYLRRQLSELRPDLVIQVVVPNDIEDSAGVRGFGVMAGFSTQHRQRGDVKIGAGFPLRLGFKRIGLLRLGLDWESQARYQAGAQDIQRLAQAVEHSGSRYRLLVSFRQLLPLAGKWLAGPLDPEWVVYLSSSLNDPQYTIARGDSHWNPAGHARVARLIYGLITRDGLLPRLRPGAWQEASEVLEDVAGDGQREAERELTDDQTLALYGSPEVRSSLNFTDLNSTNARWIHGGVDLKGRVAPYASLMLRNEGGQRLRIMGRTLRRPELEGARVRVFVDADEVGAFEIEPDQELALTYQLPQATLGRAFLNVRFEASDYVYKGRGLQRCVAFSLHRVAIDRTLPELR